MNWSLVDPSSPTSPHARKTSWLRSAGSRPECHVGQGSTASGRPTIAPRRTLSSSTDARACVGWCGNSLNGGIAIEDEGHVPRRAVNSVWRYFAARQAITPALVYRVRSSALNPNSWSTSWVCSANSGARLMSPASSSKSTGGTGRVIDPAGSSAVRTNPLARVWGSSRISRGLCNGAQTPRMVTKIFFPLFKRPLPKNSVERPNPLCAVG